MIKKIGRKIKNKIRTWLGIYPPRTSEIYIEQLRRGGAKIGERVTIFHPPSTVIDETRPYLIEIGDDVQITHNVSILTHGYDFSVLKGIYGEVLGSAGKVKIGNNVFIGAGTTILKGVEVGNNVIIGAASLVNKNIPDNCVVAGNPAKFIMSIDEYYEKRKRAQLNEAAELVIEYRKAFGKDPELSDLSEFFFLFSNTDDQLDESCKKQLRNLDNYDYSVEVLSKNNPQFASFEEFLKNIEGR